MDNNRAAEPLRLAPASEPGAHLYNSFHLLTQMSGLYGQAAQYEPDTALRQSWDQLCEQAVTDIGDLVSAWEAQLAESKNGAVCKISPAAGAAVVRACKRLGMISEQASLWTPMARWARILLLAEKRWARVLDDFTAVLPSNKSRLANVIAGASARRNRLDTLISKYKIDGDTAAAAFEIHHRDAQARKAGR